ncbi:MAG: hypothetical protein KF900_04310 [Bacteroidetes bacterium]|nr:hypothetical protein [Bacteroidota bacterium]
MKKNKTSLLWYKTIPNLGGLVLFRETYNKVRHNYKMQKESSFVEFIQHICARPKMYTLGGTYNETAAFVVGFSAGSVSPINDRSFDSFVCLKNSFPTNYVWTYVIKKCAKDDNEAILLMQNTILEFIELKDKMTEEELMRFAIESSKSEEGEAGKTFRKFDSALLTGDKEVIQSLIIESKGAEILWSGYYPEDVALKLNEISSRQPIKQIPISEDGNKVEIISQGLPFPVEMNFINGKWRINAEKIIALRMSNK